MSPIKLSTQLHTLNGTSAGSAIFVRLTAHGCAQKTAHRPCYTCSNRQHLHVASTSAWCSDAAYNGEPTALL